MLIIIIVLIIIVIYNIIIIKKLTISLVAIKTYSLPLTVI